MNSQQLITSINEISRSAKYVKKDIRLTLKKDLEQYRKYATTQEVASLDEITKIISTTVVTAEMRFRLQASIEPVKKVINRFAIDDAEAGLDANITRYNKYTNVHPMKGVSLNRSTKGYTVAIRGSRRTCKNLDDACKLMIEDYRVRHKAVSILADPLKHLITNDNCTLIRYSSQNAEYFDVQHILCKLGVRPTAANNKYKSVEGKIDAVIVHKNRHGGCIFRELISLKVVKLIMCFSIGPAKAFITQLLGIKTTSCLVMNKETECISRIQAFFREEQMITQRSVGKYRIDLYFPEYRLAIECDENGHADRNPKKEAKRQAYIETTLGATFVRFNPDEAGFDILVPVRSINRFIMARKM